jgi:hypothetical protein
MKPSLLFKLASIQDFGCSYIINCGTSAVPIIQHAFLHHATCAHMCFCVLQAHAQKSSRRRLPPLMVGEDYGMDALPPCVIKVIGVGGGGSNAVF